MKARIAQWLDAHADPDWRNFHLLYENWIALTWALVSGLWIFTPALNGLIPLWMFGCLCFGVPILICIARITKQPGLM